MTESVVEQAALAWLEALGYGIAHGPEIGCGQPGAEREDWAQVVLEGRLRQALQRLNPKVPASAIEEAFRKLTRPDSPSLLAGNHAMHRLLVEGVPVEYQRNDNSLGGDIVRVIDFDDPDNNDFLAVNQLTVVENKHERRPDVVLYVNGLPLAVIELKNAADENATIWGAFNQLQTYKQQIPTLFTWNAALVISDGVQARIGTLTADRERFMPWRTIAGEDLAPASMPELQVVLEGAFEKTRFLQLVRHFIVFEDEGGGKLIKKMAGYHQFHAVNLALAATLKATGAGGDRRVGVVWHTQGSGKSLTMAFYAGRVILEPAMKNPTVVVITDRNDLDDQLFGTFARCKELLRQEPMQAENRDHLRALLKTDSGGVIFTTVHKFFPTADEAKFPLLSERRNIVVMADEAHRSQYDFVDGFAAPCLHTMYADKPMRGHGLMQALATYTESGGKGQTAIDQQKAVALMQEKYEICAAFFHGFDYSGFTSGNAIQKLGVLPAAQEHVLKQNDGKNRFVKAVVELSKAFALAVPADEAMAVVDDVAFFQAVKSVLIKTIEPTTPVVGSTTTTRPRAR